MFRLLNKKIKYLHSLLGSENQTQAPKKGDRLSGHLERDLANFKRLTGESTDIVVRKLTLKNNINAAIIFIDGLVFELVIRENVLEPLVLCGEKEILDKKGNDLVQALKNRILPVASIREEESVEQIVNAVFSGDTMLLVDGSTQALLINAPGWERRMPSEPESEIVVKGPREGFVETLRTNTSMLRRRVGHPGLTFEDLVLGQKTQTKVSIAYLKGVVRPELVDEVKRRLERINTDAILAAGYVEQYIEDAPFSPFMTVDYTERPDVTAAKLMEGRVAIMVDGTPIANTVPTLFIEFFQSPDDYNARPFYATILRWFRYFAFFAGSMSPGIFVALATFHQEFLPTPLLISMAAASEGTPFPAVVEAMGMGLIFEILREAGIRLPKPIGSAMSIVGALVIGDAAVSAGFIEAYMVIVVSFTAIASFAVPKLYDVCALLRIAFTVMAGLFGVFGLMLVFLFLIIHLVSLRSFGVPYLSPISPLMPKDLKDVLVRVPLWSMVTRPESIGVVDPVRRDFNLMPQPEEDENSLDES
ncbi:spore germination protein [Dehalobacterium formicoaceticum]|uniref:Spore germination protein n=1 Tax=Dehalobacterium formicoaceticum TaxID=51515 RepID=A0ABT1Y1D1_9FIRM|nr:spore germination protein [Dehalobacterium formicoaceticum]MCR6544321.1 spore germination protein [Dehalobacterium formicoaceticum]